MKRDIELVRTILQKIADEANPDEWYYVEIDGREELEVIYHIRLLSQAGLITVINLSSKDGESYAITGLSWSGHEFVEATRSDGVWKKAKEKINKIGGSFTFELIKEVSVKIASELLMS